MHQDNDRSESAVIRKRRRKKLIEPRIQLRFVAAFACTAGLAVICQALVLSYLLISLASRAPNDQAFLLESIPRALGLGVLITGGLLLPLSIAVGVLTTFPVVGPLYRFRVFMNAVLAGEHPEPCRIRERDEMHEFCELLNEVTETVRAQDQVESEEGALASADVAA